MRLAHDGIVVVIVGIEKKTGHVVSGPDIISRGFVFEDVSQELMDEARDAVVSALRDMPAEAKSELAEVQTKVRSSLKKFIKKRMERWPMIVPVVMEI